MTKKLPQRRSPRLKNYDYAQNGAYFITICTQHRQQYFGHITEQTMHLNPAGEMVQAFWNDITGRFSAIECDVSVVMPNHLHGILVLTNSNQQTIIEAIQWFKSITTSYYRKGVHEDAWQPYDSKLWQRSFHDHVIRNESSLNKLREYVLYNPALWEKDTFYE
ncbi:MAG: transposase [Chloroflexota bacterium]